jgi:squalene-associated FAD-dependent desaturase
VDRDAHQLARSLMKRRVAVVGGGWAGLAAAVHAVDAGHEVTLYEMAPQLGGRARRVEAGGVALDNGQHILIGAYRDTLALMARVGVPVDEALLRRPLALLYPDGSGLRLAAGHPVPAFVRAVLRYRGWSWAKRAALLAAAARWGAQRFTCDASWTVARLVQTLPAKVRDELIEPLCVAALNTPGERASAAVFLRVLRDALFSGPGAADLLLPRRSLSALLPEPAEAWLLQHGARVRRQHRVQSIERPAGGWLVDGERHDAVVLAATATEAARLAQGIAPAWATLAAAFEYEPIITVYVRSAGTRLPQPMTALHAGTQAPAQFVFDLGALGAAEGVFALVVSGARAWSERGLEVAAQAALDQAVRAFPAGTWQAPPTLLKVLAERRATFLCTPGLQRPPVHITPGLAACGDYVEGPYPATLEGAVRSARAALRLIAQTAPPAARR